VAERKESSAGEGSCCTRKMSACVRCVEPRPVLSHVGEAGDGRGQAYRAVPGVGTERGDSVLVVERERGPVASRMLCVASEPVQSPAEYLGQLCCILGLNRCKLNGPMMTAMKAMWGACHAMDRYQTGSAHAHMDERRRQLSRYVGLVSCVSISC